MDRDARSNREIVHDIEDAIVELAENPEDTSPANIEKFQNFPIALNNEFANNAEIQRSLATIVRRRPEDSIAYVLRLLRIGTNRVALEAGHTTLDTSVSGYTERIHEELLNSPRRIDNNHPFDWDLTWRTVQTQVYRRGFWLKVLSQAYPDRIPENPIAWDLGAALGHTFIRLARPELETQGAPYEGVRIMDSPYRWNSVVEENVDEGRTAFLHENYVKKPFQLGPSVAIDIFGFNDQSAKMHVKACRYPSEFTPELLRQFDMLDEGHPNVVGHGGIDLTNEGSIRRRAPNPTEDERPHIINAASLLYMISSRIDQLNILKYMHRIVRPDGFIVVTDAMRVNKKNCLEIETATELYNHENNPYNFRTAVKDMSKDDARFEEIVRAKNGRMVDVVINRDSEVMKRAFRDYQAD